MKKFFTVKIRLREGDPWKSLVGSFTKAEALGVEEYWKNLGWDTLLKAGD